MTLAYALLRSAASGLPVFATAGDRPRAAGVPMERPGDEERDYERRPRKGAADRRRNARQRILDQQAARRAQPARGVLPRVLQAAAAALLHRSLHARRATWSTTRSWDAARRSWKRRLPGGRPPDATSIPLSAMLAQPRLVAADGGRGGTQRSPRARSVDRRFRARKSSRCSITRRRFARSARCANTSSHANARDALDGVDRWIRMVAVNRLTGHSPGFFSVYTLPPNQAASLDAQAKINARAQAGAARGATCARSSSRRRDRCSPTATPRRAPRCSARRTARALLTAARALDAAAAEPVR